MSNDIQNIRNKLVGMLSEHIGPLQVCKDSEAGFEVKGTIPTMQGKQKVDGIYFASVVPKPKDVRLYFFPVYTHKSEVGELPENLQKCLKGKSCFHIKKWDDALEASIKNMIDKSVKVYQKAELLTK